MESRESFKYVNISSENRDASFPNFIFLLSCCLAETSGIMLNKKNGAKTSLSHSGVRVSTPSFCPLTVMLTADLSNKPLLC